MKIIIAPPGTPPPNTMEDGVFYTVDESGVTPWQEVPVEDIIGLDDSTFCRECRKGNHAECIGYALDPNTDTVVRCGCAGGDPE